MILWLISVKYNCNRTEGLIKYSPNMYMLMVPKLQQNYTEWLLLTLQQLNNLPPLQTAMEVVTKNPTQLYIGMKEYRGQKRHTGRKRHTGKLPTHCTKKWLFPPKRSQNLQFRVQFCSLVVWTVSSYLIFWVSISFLYKVYIVMFTL